MRVLFIVPPYRTTDGLVAQLFPMPLGPVSLGTVLKELGHEVKIKNFLLPSQKHKVKSPASFARQFAPPYIHYGMPIEDCFRWLNKAKENYDVFCLAMGQCNIYETGVMLSQHIKSNLRKPLLIGGPFVTTATQEAMLKTGADVAVTGEAEDIIGTAVEQTAKGFRGIIKGGSVNISKLPLPDWTLSPPIMYPPYKGKVRGVLTISRGCPFSCSFCSVSTVMGRNHRRQSRERIRAELLNLWDFGVRYFCFLDDNLFINEKAVDDILWAISSLDGEITGFSKCRFYTEEGIEVRVARTPGLLARLSRFDNIALGLETLNERARDTAKKPYSKEDLILTLRELKKANIAAKAFYIIGFPEDTIESVCRNIVAFGKLGLAVRANNLKLYPNTDLTKEALRKNIIKADYDWRKSSWHTPHLGSMSYADIRHLKSILRAVGKMAESFGISVFSDPWEEIKSKLAKRKYTISLNGKGGMTLKGNMYRPNDLRHFLSLLLLRENGNAQGVTTKIMGDQIIATPALQPINNIQRALLKAIHPNVTTSEEGFGLC